MPHSEGSIVVTGSLNMDFVVQVERLPAPGETIPGWDFEMVPGGKGANQANAAGRLTPRGCVRMVGRVGADDAGERLTVSLASAGVDVASVTKDSSFPTGIAMIWVEAHTGQNSIVVSAEANGAFTPAHVADSEPAFEGARFVLFQLESPLETVEAAMRLARKKGAQVILDPAPARPLPPRILECVNILTPNESEACVLLGRPVSRVTEADAPALARDLLTLGPSAVILKLGERGCFFADGRQTIHSPGFRVEPVDSTAAGDTFNGALAVAFQEDQPLESALRFANAAAALSVTRFGAQTSAPSREEVNALLAQT